MPKLTALDLPPTAGDIDGSKRSESDDDDGDGSFSLQGMLVTDVLFQKNCFPIAFVECANYPVDGLYAQS